MHTIPLRNTRYTTSSLLVAMKVHRKVAQPVLLHSKFTMTFDVYSEAGDEEIRESYKASPAASARVPESHRGL